MNEIFPIKTNPSMRGERKAADLQKKIAELLKDKFWYV